MAISPQIILWLFFCVNFSINTAIATESSELNNLSVKQAILIALDNNPNLASMNTRFLAMSEIPAQVGAFPEPKLKFNFANIPLDSFALDQTPMTQIQFGITQALPYPGKLALKSQAALNLAEASGADWRDAKRKLIEQTRHQWWQLFYLDRALEIVARNQGVLYQFIEVAETKYSVGQGLQQDILLAQVEEYQLQDKKLQLLSFRRTTQARLNLLMGSNKRQNILISPIVDEQLPTLGKMSDYLSEAKQSRPDMKRANLLSDAAESRFKLAKKNYYPDFQVGALYGWRKDQTGLASLQFSMNVPWDISNRQNPAKDQRNQEWLQQKYALLELENRIAEEIESATANYLRATNQMRLFKDAIIPKAEQTVEAMLAGYQVNKVDFLNLLRAQITLFNYDTQYWQAFSTANQYLAALDAAIGRQNAQEFPHE